MAPLPIVATPAAPRLPTVVSAVAAPAAVPQATALPRPPAPTRSTSVSASASAPAPAQASTTVLQVKRKAVAPSRTPPHTRPEAHEAEAPVVLPVHNSECTTSPSSAELAAVQHVQEAIVVQQASSAAPSTSAACTAPEPDSASVTGSSVRCRGRDQNSVTIKRGTVVKDAAGAIDKILSRGVTALVTALRQDNTYDSLNQAVKSIAVARHYMKISDSGSEVTFLPFHRLDASERVDTKRFAFLVNKTRNSPDVELKTADQTDLNVARGSDINKMANAIISIMLDRGQAVMKAAGGEAIFVAMSAVINARHRLIQKHSFDLMLAVAWITEDTVSTLGRESKFLRFNVLRTEPNGPKSTVAPVLPAAEAL